MLILIIYIIKKPDYQEFQTVKPFGNPATPKLTMQKQSMLAGPVTLRPTINRGLPLSGPVTFYTYYLVKRYNFLKYI